MRHYDIEEIDSVADERQPDCPACQDPLDDGHDRHSHRTPRVRRDTTAS